MLKKVERVDMTSGSKLLRQAVKTTSSVAPPGARCTRGRHGLAASILLCAVSAQSHAQLHGGDIVLDASTGVIRTGQLAGSAFVERRAFSATMGQIAPLYTSDPGFDCQPGTFVSGSRVAFRVRDALRVWNGQDFSQVPIERLEIARSSAITVTPVAPAIVEGFALSVGANGQWHRHYEYTLVHASQVPADGVYLLQLSLTNNAPAGPGESLPFFVVFNNNAAASDVLAAEGYVENVLVGGTAGCDSIDFNGDALFPDDQDLIDFLAVLAGGACSTEACSDIDFNNDGLFPDDSDLIAFLAVLAGGNC